MTRYSIAYRGHRPFGVVGGLADVRRCVAHHVAALKGRAVVGRVYRDGFLFATFTSLRGGSARFTRRDA